MSRSKKNRAFFLLALAAIVFWIASSDAASMFRSTQDLRLFLDSFGVFAPVFYIVLYVISTALFLPATPLTVASGVLFGPVLGTVLVVTGATIGATIAFFFSRFIGKSWAEEKLKDRFKTLWKYDKGLEDYGFLVTLWLRVIPLFPFNGLNFALGLTRVSARDYILGTMLGIIPGSFAYAYLGGSLADLRAWHVVLALLLLLLLSAIGILAKRATQDLSENEFDVIVIGAGAAGLNVAGFMNRVGFKVLLIDKTDKHIGGDCLNFGCIPSKALIHVAKTIGEGRAAEKFGVSVSGDVDMKAVRDYVHSKREHIREHENADYFRKKGMKVALGVAKFVGKDQVEVDGKRYRGRKIVIATGSTPRKLQVQGAEHVDLHTNESIFDLDVLPKRLLMVGGGPIGLELGQAFLSLGSEVTIVHRGERLLEKEDAEIAGVLQQQLEEAGMKILLRSEIEKFSSAHAAIVRREDEEDEELAFDAVLVSIGRELELASLNVQAAGIDQDERGALVVDPYLRTTNKKVYVVGDALGQHQFTHAAELHASQMLRNWFSPLKKKFNSDHMAWITFTDPEVATFGLSEKQLQEQGATYRVVTQDFREDDRGIVDEYTYGKLKLFVHKDKILGGSVVAPHAGSIAQELILANTLGISLSKLFSRVYPYPARGRIIKQAIGSIMAERLTGKTRWLLKVLYH